MMSSSDKTLQAAKDTIPAPKFLLIASPGPAANFHDEKLGLYRLSEEVREGRSVYIQEHDTDYHGYNPCKLYSGQGVWMGSHNHTVQQRQ